MRRNAVQSELETLIGLLARLPGLGPRSARRAALHLIKKREQLLVPLARALDEAARSVRACTECGNLDTGDVCAICRDPDRERSVICVVADIADLWALERAGAFAGRYHVLGGLLSAIEGRTPQDLRIDRLEARMKRDGVSEIILALSATVDGQMTAHYLTDRLAPLGVRLSHLAQGVPVGGELDYLDDGTLAAAMKARRTL